jgi:tetratricopeptide (TPR) repeat protein
MTIPAAALYVSDDLLNTSPVWAEAADGFRRLSGGDVAAAGAAADALLAADPDHPGGLLLRAHLAAGQGRLDEALALLNLGEAAAPESFVFPQNIGRILARQGRAAEALGALERAANRQGAPGVALLEWAAFLESEGELRKARAAYARVAPGDPSQAAAQSAISAIDAQFFESNKKASNYLGQLFDAETRYPAPYYGFTGRPFGDGGRLDAWGFANPAPPSKDKAPGETRLFLLGDSCFFDADETAGVTMAELVRAELAPFNIPGLAVYNFGVRSYLADQMLALLFFKLIDCQPDAVLIFCGGSDLFIPISYDPRPGYPYNFYVVEELYTRFFDAKAITDKEALVSHNDLLDGIVAHHAELRSKAGWKTEAWEASVVDAFASFVDKNAHLAKAYEIDIAIALQPLVTSKSPQTASEASMLGAETTDYFRRQYQRYDRLFAAPPGGSSANEFISLHNTSDTFTGCEDELFVDFIHYNMAGKRLMARRLAGIAAERLAVARARRPVAPAPPPATSMPISADASTPFTWRRNWATRGGS